MNKIPKHILKISKTATSRKWKSKKRKEIRVALKAIDDLRRGAAYLPNYRFRILENAEHALEKIKDDCSVKSWGR